MKAKTVILISVIGILFSGSLFYYINQDTYIDYDIDCYDNHNNKINGLNCEKKTYPFIDKYGIPGEMATGFIAGIGILCFIVLISFATAGILELFGYFNDDDIGLMKKVEKE